MARGMKDSGIAWIGEIPDGWQCRPIKNCFSVYSGATPKSEVTDFWDGDIVWITPADFKTQDRIVSIGKRNLTKEGYSSCGTTLVPFGSIIFSKRAPIGTVAVAGTDLCTNQGCLSCVPHEGVDTWYFYYAMSAFTEQFNLYGTGTTFKEISYNDFVNFYLPLPSSFDQSHIAEFLDRRCKAIDQIMEQTRVTIEEYKKLRQSIITEAVTHGVRGPRKMKDSGVEWIGEIPEDWEVTRFKRLGSCRNGLTYSPADQCGEEGTLVLRSSNIQNGKLSFDDCVYVNKEIPDELMVHPNDILICSRNGSAKLIGKNAIIPAGMTASFGAFMMIYRCKKPKYLQYVLSSNIFNYYLGTFLTVSVNQLTGSNFDNIIFPYTSDDSESEEIVQYLDIRCAKIDRLIDSKQQLITELEAYKKSVIYEYVTGKREVPK